MDRHDVNFGGHSAAAYPALSRVDIRGHSAAAKVTLAAEAQPAKLRKVGGYHLGANDEHAAVLTPPKLRNIGGRRSGRQNSAQISGFAGTCGEGRRGLYSPGSKRTQTPFFLPKFGKAPS